MHRPKNVSASRSASSHDEILRFLPLKAADCHLLMALAREEMYGYALLQAMADDSRGAVTMDIGALYRALDRLTRSGLISESGRRDVEPSRGKPRRYYAISELGRSVLDGELERMSRMLEVAAPEEARS